MRLSDFDFELPNKLIAQKAKARGMSRLLVLNRQSGEIIHTHFRKLSDYLFPGDCLIVNNSKVIPARLWATKEDTGAKIELLLHQEIEAGRWEALARPYRRLKENGVLRIGNDFALVRELKGSGRIELVFENQQYANRIIKKHGTTPLPPYIKRDYTQPNKTEHQDRLRYQTVYASSPGSVAAPTAGLHFSKYQLHRLTSRNIQVLPITLHVGWGTFLPLEDTPLKDVRLHREKYSVPILTSEIINQCFYQKHGRIIACGTTVARTLESVAISKGVVQAGQGETDIFIYPGYCWKITNGLLTNFHLPKSSLLALVCAFGKRELVLKAYRQAVERKYRFYSFGDAMLIL